jgi:A/G-specific adenine glycosylase
LTAVAARVSAQETEELFHDAVLQWWTAVREGRDALPWRATRDQWAVLVSETMLSQTQVARVATRYPEFLRRFPDPGALAESEPSEVIRFWSGLGYNRRGLNLRAAATLVVTRHGGHVPASLEELLQLPGVGPYTARAVLAFAFDQQVGAVDTNIARVLARAVSGEALSRPRLQRLADELASGRGRDWNLALMDFGSLVCQARRPKCDSCPLRPSCRWRSSGNSSIDPARTTAATTRPQSRFTGSEREGRGRLVRALCDGPVEFDQVGRVAGWPADPARAKRIATTLISEGLAVRDGDVLRLP